MSACTVGYIITNMVNKKKAVIFHDYIYWISAPRVASHCHADALSVSFMYLQSSHLFIPGPGFHQCENQKKKISGLSSFQRKTKRETQEQKHSIPVSYCLLFTVLKWTLSQFSNWWPSKVLCKKKDQILFLSCAICSTFPVRNTNHCWHYISQRYFSFTRPRQPWLY